jgi:hypothetical protein
LFGTTLSVRDAVVALGRPSVAQRVRVGVLSATGRVSWGAATTLAPGARTARFDLGATGSGVEVQLLSGQALHAVRVAVTTASGWSYLIAGPLANAVEPGEWKQAGTASNFTVFRSVQQPLAAWLQPPGSQQSASPGSSASGTAQVVSSSTDTATVEARATTPALLVWSTAFDPGWSAETVGGAGEAGQAGGKPLEVKRVGLVQGVEVPAGTTTVRFSYVPVGIGTGSAITAATLGALLIAGALYLIVRRRRRALNM